MNPALSEEAFRFFGKNFPILRKSLLIFGRSLPVCSGVAPQMHFGKAYMLCLGFVVDILEIHNCVNSKFPWPSLNRETTGLHRDVVQVR